MAIIEYFVDKRVAHIVINRPEQGNAFNDELALALREAWDRFERGDEYVAVVSGGSSKSFCVGADLKDLPQNISQAIPGCATMLTKPVIAAVHGWCIGAGMALVQAADICIASDDTRMLYPEAKVGTAYGVISGLAARVPHKIAMEIMLRAKPLTAKRAAEIGFVNYVVPRQQLLDVAMEHAHDIASLAPMVIRWLKEGVDRHVLPEAPIVSALRSMERVKQMRESHDLSEGIAAFEEGRSPQFQNR